MVFSAQGLFFSDGPQWWNQTQVIVGVQTVIVYNLFMQMHI